MKKLISLVLAAVMSIGMATTAAAADINVSVDGTSVTWTDAKPFIKDGRTLVPLRPIANALGLGVSWNAEAQQAGFSNGETTVVFELNSKAYLVFVGDEYTEVKMDTAAISEGGRTYAPAKYLAQAFGYSVGWDQATQTVKITSGDVPAPAPAPEVKEESSATLFSLPYVMVDDIAGTRWTYCGGFVDGKELTDEEFKSDLMAYGGFMDFFFFSENGVEMTQGAVNFLYGNYSYAGDGVFDVRLDYNGQELVYACAFTESDGEIYMIAFSDETGQNGVYFKQ